jgi:predicted permease
MRFRGDAREVVEGDLLEYFARDLAAGRAPRAARRRYWLMTLASIAGAPPRGGATGESGGLRHGRWAGALHALWSDVRLSGRRLLASPGFTVTAVLTLALAIGVNAALFSALRAVVLAPVPFEAGARMVLLWRGSANATFLVTPSARDVERWRQLDGIFEWIETYEPRSVVLLGDGEPRQIPAANIPPDLLVRLGALPELGRPFVASDAAPDAEPVTLLSHALWRSRFGGAPDIVGRVVRIGDEHVRVVGVMPHWFRLPGVDHELWLARRGDSPDRGGTALAVLRHGVDMDTARAALEGVPVGDDDGEIADGRWFGALMSPGDMFGATIRQTLMLLSGAVGLLLLLACVNVAGLVLARHRRRQRELALRLSLGASRARLFRLLMIESALVAGAGGLAGLGAARLSLAAIAAVRPDALQALERLRLDSAVILFAALATGLTALLFGLVPAFRASRWNVARQLAAGGRGASAAGLAGRGALAAFQLGAALVLLAGTLLLTQTVARLAALDPGFDGDGLVSMQLSLDGARYDQPAARGQFLDDLDRTLRALPGVTAAAHGSGLPPEMGIVFGAPALEGATAEPGEARILGGGWASPDYFPALGVDVLEGRAFTPADARGGAPVVIVSRSLARRLGGGRSLVGERLRMSANADFATIVGVVADVRANGLRGGDGEQLYRPLPVRTPRTLAFAVRTSGESGMLVDAMKAAVWAIDPDLPIASLRTMADVIWRQTATARFAMTLLGAFAAVGLALAAVGVFGTLMLVVTQRRCEVAVRLSLGATPRQVLSLVLRYVTVIAAAGVGAGLGASYLLTPYIESLLFDVPPLDAASLAAAASIVLLAALVATVAPVRRMLAVNPAEALDGD